MVLPGVLVALPLPIPKTVTFELLAKLAELVVFAMPWNSTTFELSCAGANIIKTVGLVILVANIPIMLGEIPLIP